HDGTAGTIKVYVNGVLGGTITDTGNAYSTGTNPYTPQFGGDINTSVTYTDHHDGQIDEITFYKDKTLSASEVTTLYNSGNGDSTPDTNSLFAHYDFESTTSLESQIYTPPTPQKLLGLGDISFNVGTTSASVTGSIPFWDSSSLQNHVIDGGTVTRNGGAGWDGWARAITGFTTGTAHEISWTTNGGVQHMVGIGLETSAPSTGNAYTEIDFAMYKETNANGVWIVENNSFTASQNACTGVTFSPSNVYKINISASGTVVYSIDGTTCATTTGASGTYYLTVITHNTDPVQSVTTTDTVLTDIISATGLTDNTSTAQHYSFTRDSSNLWTIYQNGVSQATATDSTSLGSNGAGSSATLYTDDFSTDKGYSLNGIASISNDLTINTVHDGSDNTSYYDMGTALSESGFEIKFLFDISAMSGTGGNPN
ncbi:MAG: hypothetical protein ACKVJN_17160, partial [Woeseiales bacterium]